MTSAEKPIEFGAAGGLGQRGGIDDGLEAGQETEWFEGRVHALDGIRGRPIEGFTVQVVPWS